MDLNIFLKIILLIHIQLFFLKNSKFFTILCSPDNNFYIRDCHDIDQYKFNNKLSLINYLNERHSFNKNIEIGGYEVPELSNIEFLIIDKKIKLNLDLNINYKKIKIKIKIKK